MHIIIEFNGRWVQCDCYLKHLLTVPQISFGCHPTNSPVKSTSKFYAPASDKEEQKALCSQRSVNSGDRPAGRAQEVVHASAWISHSREPSPKPGMFSSQWDLSPGSKSGSSSSQLTGRCARPSAAATKPAHGLSRLVGDTAEANAFKKCQRFVRCHVHVGLVITWKK